VITMQGPGSDLARGARILARDHFAIQRNENILITCDTATDPVAVNQLMTAAFELGARPSAMLIPQLPYQGLLADPFIPDPVKAAVRQCDVWLDLTFPTMAGSHTFDAAMKEKRARYLLVGDAGCEGVAHLYGLADLDRLFEVQQGIDRLFAEAQGKRGRITTARGTDVTFVFGKTTTEKTRVANRPGFQTPPGSGMFMPETESVKGVVVLDAVFHERYCILKTPLRVEVDGKIRSVHGDAPNQIVMDRALRRAGSGAYGYVIHFTYGFHPAAHFTGRSFVEDIRAVGTNAVGLGLPWWVPGGGENHPDGVMIDQSMWIEGVQVISDGRLVAPAELAGKARNLVPHIA
jgi:2,5-dihydroxypyridine 5,6-dioxygenase